MPLELSQHGGQPCGREGSIRERVNKSKVPEQAWLGSGQHQKHLLVLLTIKVVPVFRNCFIILALINLAN